MNPVLFHLPEWLRGLPIPAYGVMQFVGMLGGAAFFAWLMQRDGCSRERAFETMLETILISIVAAKAAGMLVAPPGPGGIMRLVHANGIWYAGFLTGVAWMAWRSASLGLGRAATLDRAAPAVALGHAFGRIGCLLGGCCWGAPTSMPWGVTFTDEAHRIVGVPSGIPLHPTQAYDAGVEFVLASGLAMLIVKGRVRFDGEITLLYFCAYAVARIAIETVRVDPRGGLGPLSTSQAIGLACLIVAAPLLIAGFLRQRHQGHGLHAAG